MKVLIINGPNLNLLGRREPEHYGRRSFEDYLEELKSHFSGRLEISYFQNNSEGALIDCLHGTLADSALCGIILNAGAYTHTSIALADAVSALNIPVIEVHISNIFARESFRHHSYLSAYCSGTITGLGLHGYRLALEHFLLEN